MPNKTELKREIENHQKSYNAARALFGLPPEEAPSLFENKDSYRYRIEKDGKRQGTNYTRRRLLKMLDESGVELDDYALWSYDGLKLPDGRRVIDEHFSKGEKAPIWENEAEN